MSELARVLELEARPLELPSTNVFTAIALQRRIAAAGETVGPEWGELGWQVIEQSLDELIARLAPSAFTAWRW